MKEALYSVLANRCPACHQTPVFKHVFYRLNTSSEINQVYSCCGEKYEKEPGFFYGAMYVSYALMVGWFVITWIADAVFVHSNVWSYLVFLILTIVIFSPLTFRISRLIWLNFFIHYDRSKNKVCKKTPYETTHNN